MILPPSHLTDINAKIIGEEYDSTRHNAQVVNVLYEDSSLHSSLRQPASELIQTIIVSDATALIYSVLNCCVTRSIDSSMAYEFPKLDDESDDIWLSSILDGEEQDCNSSWSEFNAQSGIASQECRDWMCIPMLWVDVLVDTSPSILPLSFSKAVFWARSHFPMVELKSSAEMMPPFHTLHHFWFLLCKLLKDEGLLGSKLVGNRHGDSSLPKFSSQGGFLKQPAFDSLPVDIDKLCLFGREELRNYTMLVKNKLGVKWIHNLMEWGKSMLKVVIIYWKRALTYLLNLFKVSDTGQNISDGNLKPHTAGNSSLASDRAIQNVAYMKSSKEIKEAF
ncbi:hypothetical protein RYX36_016497 [Vicia faba]